MTEPAAVELDLRRLDRNLHRLHRAAEATGCAVRAHAKAHRTVELTRRQVDAGAIGAAVHTAHAAKDLAAAGVTDVVVAWPWREPWRWPRYAEAARRLDRFAVHVDDADLIRGIGQAATTYATEIGVRIDLRHAPPADGPRLARVAASTSGIRLDGVTSYAAPATRSDVDDRYALGRRHAEQLVEVAEAIRSDGLPCPVVSVGGTPTASGARSVEGVTEIVVGAYATGDAGLAEIGVLDLDDVAISVASDRSDLLAGCSQPWAPDIDAVPAGDRLLPAHVCPLAKTLMKQAVDIAVVADGARVDTWRPRAKPDRE